MPWRAGTASLIITPTEPYWLAGFAARTEPAKGTISDLKVSALALEDEAGGRLVIASADIIAITRAIAEPVIERVRRATGLPRERLILAASHTHFGPEPRPDKAIFFKIPPEYAAKIPVVAQNLIDALVQTITDAQNAMEPARLRANFAGATFAHNRRRDGVKGGNPSKEDIHDHGVPIIEVSDPASVYQRKAIVLSYACHNTTIPPEDCRYCADWAGFARDQLERDNRGATALFITGCGADQNPEPRGSVELSRQYGKELADAVQNQLDATPGIELTGNIRVAMEEVPLALRPVTRDDLQAMLDSDDPPKKVKARFLLDQLARGEALMTSYPAPIQVIRLGDQLLMIVMSGEAVVDWSLKFERRFDDVAPTWVAAYCNDMPGYIPTRRIQQEGGYEGGRANLWSWVPSPWTDDIEDRITTAVDRLVAAVTR
jgi:neutral ceramidase